jgi:membrane-bound lytic murein transglycosylase D
MRLPALVSALALLLSTGVAEANDTPAEAAPAAEAPAEAPAEPANADAPAVDPAEATDAELWTWVTRLQGEVPTVETREASQELSDERMAELALVDQLGGADVPKDFYADPAATLKVDPLHLDKVDPSEFDIPIVVNDDVIKWMKYFTGPGRKYYSRWLARSTKYRPMMYAQLEEKGLPRDLVYLSMIESGYNAHAYSSADAAGLWQFIPSTARLYHLRVDYWVDDRRDPEMATEAGLAFLADLHDVFDDWMLAWAAYNTGPGRVRRATQKAGSKDFWVLEEGPYLHPETDNYVPKIIAAAIIGHHPERYGFTGIEYQDELQYEKTRVEGSVDLEVLAKCAGISLEELQALNPALRRYATPPEGYEVRLPVGRTETFVAALAAVPKEERLAATVVHHKVARGETLSKIAAKYGVATSDIVKANKLRDADRIYVGMQLVIPTKGRSSAVASAPRSSDTKVAEVATRSVSDAEPPPKAAPAPATYHTVRSGETLFKIAVKYGVDVSQLKSWNGLKSDTIFVGQKLKVSSGSGSSGSATASAKAAAPSGTKTSYTVQKGDTLSAIADKHGVTLSQVQKWNGISNPSDIQAGQKLVIYTAAPQWEKYTVKSGDSLGAIATRYGCTVAQIKEWNDLSSSVIHPGQVLKIAR